MECKFLFILCSNAPLLHMYCAECYSITMYECYLPYLHYNNSFKSNLKFKSNYHLKQIAFVFSTKNKTIVYKNKIAN